MKPLRPYLVRALVDWIVDNDQTPFLVIDCNAEGGSLPADYAVDGKLVLNVSPAATRNLLVAENELSVDCRFRGRPFHVATPIDAVLAVYAKETGLGMAFDAESAPNPPPSSPDRSAKNAAPTGPKLKLVK